MCCKLLILQMLPHLNLKTKYVVGSVVILILKKRKLRLKDDKVLARDHTSNGERSRIQTWATELQGRCSDH